MSVLRKLKGSLSQLSASLSPTRLTRGHCKQCGRRTRWVIDIGRGYFRCIECHDESDHRRP